MVLRSTRELARDLLTEALSDGPRRTTEVRDYCARHGASDRSIHRARAELGVVARRTGYDAEGHLVVESAAICLRRRAPAAQDAVRQLVAGVRRRLHRAGNRASRPGPGAVPL